MRKVFKIKVIFALVFITLTITIYHRSSGATEYDIGSNFKYKSLKDFNWDVLHPGDVVRIHWRKEPYHEKIVIRSSGTKNKPIIIRGIRGPSKDRPIIDGSNALHFQKMTDSQKIGRGLITIGDGKSADNIVIDGFEIRNANNSLKFLFNNQTNDYPSNAAGIFVDKGKNIHVKRCIIHSCCMGIITNYYPNVDNFILSNSFIYNNGDFTMKRWGHNVYLCARNTLVQFNRFGELHSDGNNIKDRSQHTIIRYNWIEGGMSRQIDLVEYNNYKKANAYVYGNVIVQGRKVSNPKMILYGGDTDGSRGGTLYLFNNTVHAKSGKLHSFLFVNRYNCRAQLYNNFMLGKRKSKIWLGRGRVMGDSNLFPLGSETSGFKNTLIGGHEQMIGVGPIPYFPRRNSILKNRGTLSIPYDVKYVPLPIAGGKKRPFDGQIDIGAYEIPAKKLRK